MNYLQEAHRSPQGNASMDVVLSNLGIELPGEGIVLDIGSGEAALLERQGMFHNPDIKIVAYNPFLHDYYYRMSHMREAFDLTDVVDSEEVPAIAGVSQQLPFKDGSFDMVVSHAAVPEYLPTHPDERARESFRLTFTEANRVVKSGGTVVMGPMLEKTSEFSRQLLDELGYDYKIEEVPLPDYAYDSEPWFRLSFDKQ